MTHDGLVWIYLTGPSFLAKGCEMRVLWDSMLLGGEVDLVEVIDTVPTCIKKDKTKILSKSDALLMVTDNARLPGVMTRLRNEYSRDDLKAYALPVLDAIV